MADYDFSTLNSTDLEELVCDLLNANQLGVPPVKYRTFKEGKDKGIDFLYSTETKPYEHVGQVKHYYKTGYKGMFAILKDDEVLKVKKLDPNKYIFATSVDLGVSNVEAIKDLFAPYIKSLEDIYGKRDLNRLIEENPKVLTDHYKLWFSDTSVLGKILNSDLEFRSASFVEHELKRRLRIYVQTPVFERARKSLKENRFIVITGEPGVGKTTLAEMLIYEYITHDYKLTYILDDIKEAERVLTPDQTKQIIYFDDFLGSNAVEINKAKGSEASLRKILRRITAMENKLIVFTTRSFLLNTAVEESENLKRFNLRAKESVLELHEYQDDVKEKVLKNHIEESEINGELKSVLLTEDIEKFILGHVNFSPRSVEFITTKEVVNDFSPEEYREFIFSSFNSPSNIWEHAYSEQIKEDDRLLLNTLLSFGESATLEELEKAFQSRLELEIKTNNKRKKINAFLKALSRLNGGFIIIKNPREVNFINPSVIDFLLDYLRKDNDEVMRIAQSVCFATQLTERLFSLSSSKEIEMPSNLKQRLLNDYLSFTTDEDHDSDLIKIALVMYKYIKSSKAEDVVCKILEAIKDWEALYDNYSLKLHFKEFMDSVRESPRINSIIEERIGEILTELVTGENEAESAIDLLEELIIKYNVDLSSFESANLDEYIDQLIGDQIEQEEEWLKDYITYEDEADEKRRELEKLIKRAKEAGLSITQNLYYFDCNDWFEIAMENEFHRLMQKDD